MRIADHDHRRQPSGRTGLLMALCCGTVAGLGTFALTFDLINLSMLTRAEATTERQYGPGSVHRHWQPTRVTPRIPESGPIAELFVLRTKGERADVAAAKSFGTSDFIIRNDRAEQYRKQVARELASMSDAYREVTGVNPDFDLTPPSRNSELAKSVLGIDPVFVSRDRSHRKIPLPVPRSSVR